MKNTLKLIAFFVLWILLWIAAVFWGMPVILMVVLGVISIISIIQNKNIEKQDIIIGTLLGIISMPSSLIMGFFTIPAYMGAMCIFKRNDYHKIVLIQKERKQVWTSIILSLVIGVALGIINVFLANTTIHFSIKLQWILDAVRAGITEEVMFRFFFFSMCVYMVKDEKISKAQNILCYLNLISCYC